jgi:putative Ca2+/H+ antiporter (TMEM165/GDT1 family)
LGGPGSGSNGSSGGRVLLRSVLEVAVVMFLAEWGDRSMLATVALGAAQVRLLCMYCLVGCCRSLQRLV